MTARCKADAGLRTIALTLALVFAWAAPALRSRAAEHKRTDEPGFRPDHATPFTCRPVRLDGQPASLSQATVAFTAAAASPPSAIGVKRILLYRVDFSDFTGAAISSNVAATLLGDLDTYYREMSYGLMSFAPVEFGSVVTETLRLPQPSTTYDNSFTRLITDTRQAAVNAGYAPASFDFDIVCTGAKPSAIFGGISYVGGPGMWIANSNFNVGVIGHELGHNLGLPHASFWYTAEQSVIGPGVKQEYGDIFDSMGVPGGSTSHFNTRFKNLLGWIPDSDVPMVTTNGTYRINAHDHPAASGRRALRIARNESLNYWVEFRQSFNNRWVTNGASLRWAGNEVTNTLLLDTTVGTPLNTQDAPILIGRTFSDSCIDLHITPVGKGGTTPESIDVVVNRGPFPGNRAPGVAITASATNVAASNLVTLQAIASDDDGDALAYYWDFGDGNFGGNQPNLQYAWARDGEYVARCTVTDMKGATASASVMVRVGTVTTFLVSGRVMGLAAPLEGVLVKMGSRFTYTDSDGTYRLSRLTAGRQTLTPILERYNVLSGGFDNPVTVGPSIDGLDFVALPDSLNAITLVSTGSVWRYLDTGTAPGADWTGTLYDDGAWSSGRAKLGYGVGDETTLVSFGPNSFDRHLTTWFRQRFVVEDATLLNHLAVRLRRDDGAVVYLNGHEVDRENLPAGEILASTTALADVNSGEEQVFFKRLLPVDDLVTGTNILAVEVHQFRTNSPDLSFDLELIGMADDGQALRPRLVVQRSGAEAQLSWAAGYSTWSLYSARELQGAGTWLKSITPVILSNGSNAVSQSPTNASGYYQLRRADFCSPFQ